MTTKRIVKSHQDITVTEVTLSGNGGILSRAYAVRAASDPRSTQQFGDMASAEAYFEQLILQRLNPTTRR